MTIALLFSLTLSAQVYTSPTITLSDKSGAITEYSPTRVYIENDSLIISDNFSDEIYKLVKVEDKLFIFASESGHARILIDNHVIYVIEEPIIGAKRSFIATKEQK